MKKIIYIYSILFLALFSCQDDTVINDNGGETSKTTLNFSLEIPEYKSLQTRSAYDNIINNIYLLVFDANGLFLERVLATNLTSTESGGIGTGSFKAQVPSNASIIHFVANYDQWASFDDRSAFQKDEKELIPSLSGNTIAFWGRNVISTLPSTINVTLFRNQAKVTVENSGAANFQLTGYAIANYTTRGTVAPFNPTSTPTPFLIIDNIPTIPQGTVDKASQVAGNCDLNPKYMFENQNLFSDQTYIIIKGKLNGGAELFYKIQFLNTSKQPLAIVRNYLYRVVIQSFNGNASGTASFEDAKNAEPSNNIYAEILKESTSIADANNNILTVSNVNYLFTKAGTLSMTASYTVNGTANNSLISVSLLQDQGSILSGLQYNGTGTITATVAAVVAGQQQATFVVKAGILSRVITVVASPAYLFTPVTFSPAVYTAKDQAVTLNFNIPGTVPTALFPLKCSITSKNLYPVSPNQNMQIEYVAGVYKYIYWATEAGAKSLNFKTSLENNDETVTIENDYFTTASVALQARHFSSVSINNTATTNVVNYGTNATATYRFTLSDITGNLATYPLTVFIATSNLKTTQTGWTAVTGGYQYVYTTAPSGVQTVAFTSNKNISKENVTISAAGFAPTTISYDNVLTANTTVTNSIRALVNGSQLNIPNYSITSSNTAIVANFTTSNSNSNSTYSFPIKTGAKLSDMLTFTTSSYTGSYTVEQLLAAPIIIVK
ncbi:hypothetical protein CLV62_1398 [Dysgonomonas alginatilytica]|uniref:Uncharacterized protein n=1 Tax=Dysgonomonas alginatilytica TaxID=1605892 RepID=A0A2V3PK54_9BACT|nr:hypothetical protein [Dysgonomonas alginatilytica]PXV59271.1 hypothetical protein CLV62_1398 [Dysgonomonas alginatilytica]